MKLANLFKGFLRIKLLLGILLLACFTVKSQTSKKLITVYVLDAKNSELNLTHIADDIKYLPLGNEIFLSEIEQVKYFDEQYFVIDKNKGFFRFSEKGKLLNQIGKQGKGPGEYLHIVDFVVHPQTGNIYSIRGEKPNHIMVFSLNGKYLQTIELKNLAKNIGITNQNLCIYYFDSRQNIEKNIEILDKDGNMLVNYFAKYNFTRDRVHNYWSECILYSFGGHLHFKEIHSDTIFYLNGEKIVPKVILNSGDRKFTPGKREIINNNFLRNPTKVGETLAQTLRPINLFETVNYIFYFYRYDRKGRMLAYNKLTNNQIEIDSDIGIKNDIDGGPNIILKRIKDYNTVLSWISAYELKQYIESKEFKNSTPKYPEKKNELEKLANSLDENDNPVLMLVKLKE